MGSLRRLLEIAAGSLESALAAQAGGADRVELCGSLDGGGVTPSFGMIALARERLRIPLYVLIRPRAGDFVYSPAELESMHRDVEACARLGCDGIVIGMLDAGGAVDVAGCRVLVAAAGSLGVTFHRAFDCVADRHAALDAVVALGCERVLTSGGADSAEHGAAVIAADIAHADGRIALMPGAGLNPGNIGAVARATGARDFHASAREFQPGIGREGPAGLARGHWRSSQELVRRLRQALDAET
ncbi:copper homeostasis protein CutC [Thermomonas carbonis]|uniref:PF03932 family protein CutC n=1 Tax=Thermomonas carbonis TaxID=1463158 RepID=A0A7G9SMF3_9GAMM|nr:copper homeostasis protein CutC [Thermomonas carbonis]QNN69028.1 copper homeostasis protein CutC [Thermomonas carbonis]GHC07221.1 copper homeostasis protein CutC [Thermomonas carbonis]